MLVRSVIVHDKMDVELSRYIGVDMLEKAQEHLMTMSGSALGQDLTVCNIKGRKQCRGAMSDRAVGDALDITQPKWQNRLRTLERLNLARYVDAEHDRMIRRIEIEPDNVLHLVDKQRIGGKLEALGAMRLNAEQGEHPRHRALR